MPAQGAQRYTRRSPFARAAILREIRLLTYAQASSFAFWRDVGSSLHNGVLDRGGSVVPLARTGSGEIVLGHARHDMTADLAQRDQRT